MTPRIIGALISEDELHLATPARTYRSTEEAFGIPPAQYATAGFGPYRPQSSPHPWRDLAFGLAMAGVVGLVLYGIAAGWIFGGVPA